MGEYKFTKARKKALKKARKKWMSMNPKKRRKAMPSKTKTPSKRYPVGKNLYLDVGRPNHHYIEVEKTKHGWKQKKIGGKKLFTKKTLRKKTKPYLKKARGEWMSMSHKKRKKEAPERKGKKGYKKITKYITRDGNRIKMHYWVKK